MDFFLLLKILIKNTGERLNGNYSQKRLDHAKQYAKHALKTASKRTITNTEATGNLIGNKIADEIAGTPGQIL